jgi:hypothetical protein
MARRDWNLLAITLDLAVPPLSLLGMLVLGVFGLSFLYAIAGYSAAALAISTVSLLAFALATFLAWLKCGRDVVPPSALLQIPFYAFRKFKLYHQLISGKADAKWTRTDRTK